MKLFYTILIIALCTSLVQAQEERFQSIVVDSATFSPLPYVTVLVKGKGRGVVTDTKGDFSVVASREDTLVFSFVGYVTAEYALLDWEPGLIRLAEKKIILKEVTVRTTQINRYQGMFDEENERIASRHNKFYYSRAKKEKRNLGWLKEDNARVTTYVDVVINSNEVKNELMKKYSLTEKQYYDILAKFNEKNSDVMYYLTAGELVTLIKNFFARSLQQN